MSSEAVERIQRTLKLKNFDPGEIDGVWGRQTAAAVRRFQAANNLAVDGIVGPAITAALFGAGAPPPATNTGSVLVWFEEARHLIGTKEIGGDADNPAIMQWADDLDIHYSGDDVPWCGLFAAHCIGSTLPGEPLPANPLGARNWSKFGVETTPRLGAVLVFWRGSPTSGLGHVGFYNGESDTAFQVLGGNTHDDVSLAWIAKDRLVGARWPRTAASLTSGTVTKAHHEVGPLSTNEQ